RPVFQPGAQGFLDVALTDGADLAMRLRDDHVRTQLFEQVGVNAVDGGCFLKDGFDALIDLGTAALDVELRRRADWQTRYRLREGGIGGTAGKVGLEGGGKGGLGRGGDQGGHARHGWNSQREIPIP